MGYCSLDNDTDERLWNESRWLWLFAAEILPQTCLDVSTVRHKNTYALFSCVMILRPATVKLMICLDILMTNSGQLSSSTHIPGTIALFHLKISFFPLNLCLLFMSPTTCRTILHQNNASIAYLVSKAWPLVSVPEIPWKTKFGGQQANDSTAQWSVSDPGSGLHASVPLKMIITMNKGNAFSVVTQNYLIFSTDITLCSSLFCKPTQQVKHSKWTLQQLQTKQKHPQLPAEAPHSTV